MPQFLFRIRSHLAALMLMTSLMFSFSNLSAVPSGQYVPAAVPVVVNTGNDQGYTIKVLALRTAGKLMIDLESLARALRLSSRQEQSGLVAEEYVGMPGSVCIIMADNNFVRVLSRDPGLPERVIQLQSAPSMMQSKILLPVTQACRLLTLWLDREVVYNDSSGQIQALLGRKISGESIGKVSVVSSEEHPVAEGSVKPAESGRTLITGIEVKKRSNGAIIIFSASGFTAPASLVTLNAEGYTYFSLEKASCDINALTKVYESGVVKAITPKQVAGSGLQFTVALDNRSFVINSVEFQRDNKHNNYLLYINCKADVEEIRRKEKERQISRVINRDIEKWRLDTIVLDAGHGGKDPGAIGGNGTIEKDVALNIIRDLGMLIRQKWPDVRVIYTRKNDTFIPLHERGRIANQSGGKLFISVHCNASTNRNACGTEVYILGPHKTKEALDVAMFENSVIREEADANLAYKGFTEEYLIMSSMAQSAFARQSTSLARHILKPEYRQSANNSRGVRQAGFMVLWTPSMPSALVEVGYLSNPGEEQMLRDRQEQSRIAASIFQGVQAYRKNYEASSMVSIGR